MSEFRDLPDLVERRLGGRALAASDEFFAPKERLVEPAPPRFDPDRYTDRGKWMDGWETRRRRVGRHGEGPDWCILRLGAPARLRGIVVDTSHFRGNYPESCSLEASWAPLDCDIDHLLGTARWTEFVPRSRLEGDTANAFAVDPPLAASHLRLSIYPDGGVARLRAHGEPLPKATDLGGSEEAPADLASVLVGARVVDSSDAFFGAPVNLLVPGPSAGMSDGWETRRRRSGGNDWVVVRLATECVPEAVEVDTSFFRGNAPAEISVETACSQAERPAESDFREVLSRTAVEPDSVARYRLDEERVATYLRLQIYPDGGVARLRVFGRATEAGRAAVGLRRLDALPEQEARRALAACCAAERWIERMLAARPFESRERLLEAAERIWRDLDRADWLEAFAAHPRIGQLDGIRRDAATAARWSSQEQAGAQSADAATLVELAEANRRYEERFGHLFIVCATGKSAAEMLALLEQRLENSPDRELETAAAEQAAITRLRLEKLLTT